MKRYFFVRKISCIFAISALTFTIFYCKSQDSLEQKKIVIASWGGTYQAAQRDAYFIPFQNSSSIEVVETNYQGQYAKIKSMVESGNVSWDIVSIDLTALLLGVEDNLYEPIDYTVVDKSSLMPEAIHPYGVAHLFFSTVMAFHTEVYKEESSYPSSWKDFWNTKKFPGKRSLRNQPEGNLEFALLADGVPKEKIYPINVDRAFQSLDKIKNNIVFWWKEPQQIIQAIISKEVIIGSGLNGRIWEAEYVGKQPITLIWNEGLLEPEYWVVLRGSKNKYEAMKFIAFAMEAKNQANFANIMTYGPTNRLTFEFIKPEIQEHLPTYPENLNGQLVINGDWWVKNKEKILPKWIQWLRE